MDEGRLDDLGLVHGSGRDSWSWHGRTRRRDLIVRVAVCVPLRRATPFSVRALARATAARVFGRRCDLHGIAVFRRGRRLNNGGLRSIDDGDGSCAHDIVSLVANGVSRRAFNCSSHWFCDRTNEISA